MKTVATRPKLQLRTGEGMKRRGVGKKSARAGRRRGVPREVLLSVLLIVALATLVRVAYVAEVHNHPLMTTTTGDPKAYDERGLEIAGGKWLGDEVYFHSSPIYPYILGLIFRLFGHRYAAVWFVQSLFGIGSCLLIFSIAGQLLGRPAGVVAGVIAALYVPFVFFDFEILMISIVIFFALLAIRMMMAFRAAPALWRALAAGGALGVSALGKPNVLLFVPFALLWLWWSFRGADCGRAADAPRRVWVGMALLLAGMIVVIAPMTISNYIVGGDFVLTSSNGGINFWIGNNDQADGTFLVQSDMRADLFEGSKGAAERALGHPLRPSEVSSYWFGQGFRFIREHPRRAAWLLGRKFLLFWNAYEIPNHYDINFFRTVSGTLRFDPFVFAWVIPLGFVGIYASRRSWRRLLLLYMFGGAYLLSLMPFFITSRYRLPVVPVMIMFSAYGATWLWDRLRSRERRGWLVPLAVLVVALVVVNLPLADFTFGPQYAIIGGIYRDAGDYAKAVEYYRLAVKASPEFDLAYNSLGSSLSRLGRDAEAEEVLLKALRINPRLASAESNLGLLYLRQGRVDDAKQHLLAATRLDPDLKPAWENLARLGIMTQDPGMAEAALKQMLRLDPGDAYAHWNLAIIYGSDPSRRDECIAQVREAAALDPALRAEADEVLRSLATTGRFPAR
jgi:tetratricopeptide (TPR) repeat protein